MPAQAKTILTILAGTAFCAILMGSPADEKFQAGDYREALRAYQKENLEDLSKLKKAAEKQPLADSPSWEVDATKEQISLCLFEKGLSAWLNGKPKDAVPTWIEAEKQIITETPDLKRYFRRTQLAILLASWDSLPNQNAQMEALSKAAVVIQDLPLPERPWDFACQISVEQEVIALSEYAKLLPKVAEDTFLPNLFQRQLEIQRNRQLGRFITKAPANNEPTYEALVDRVLFESFNNTLCKFFDEYLASPSGGGAYVSYNRDNFRLVHVLMSLDTSDPSAFEGYLKLWLEDMAKPNPKVVNGVLIGLLQMGMDTTDPEYSKRIFKTTTPYFGRVTWPDDAFVMKLSRALEDNGQFSDAAKLLETTLAKVTDRDARSERLGMLTDLKLKASDFAGAYEYGKQSLVLLGDKAPSGLNRTMASVCMDLKKYDEAVDFLKKFLVGCESGDQEIEAKYLVGWAYCLDKKFDLARTSFQEVIANYPHSPYAEKAQDYLKALPKVQ